MNIKPNQKTLTVIDHDSNKSVTATIQKQDGKTVTVKYQSGFLMQFAKFNKITGECISSWFYPLSNLPVS